MVDLENDGCPVTEVTGGNPAATTLRQRLRERDDRANARLRVLEADGPAATAQQLAGDREAEAAAAPVAVTGLVQAREPVEDPLPVDLRYAVPVVADAHLHLGPARLPRRSPRRSARAGPHCR